MKITTTLLAGFCVLWACQSENKTKTKNTAFPATKPILLDTISVREYVADIHSLQNVDIRTRIKGFVEKVHVDEGQMVKEGQVLFSIAAQEFREELLSAKALTKNAIAELKTAEIELANAQALFEKSVISNAQLQLSRSKVEAHQAKLEEARANESNAALQLSFTDIKAPFTGIINRIPFKAGSLVDEGSLLTTLSNNEAVFAYFNLAEADYLNYIRSKKQGNEKEVKLVLANGDLYEHKGRIETVEGEIDKQTGNIAFRARFPNPQRQLRHGATGKILWPESLKSALIIPQKAVFEIQDKNWVYVLDKEDKAQLRAVQISYRLPRLYVVSAGLSTNDRVLYEGIQKVKEGEKLPLKLVDMKQVLTELKKEN
jgi:RND family efflux transporter MFP subunit